MKVSKSEYKIIQIKSFNLVLLTVIAIVAVMFKFVPIEHAVWSLLSICSLGLLIIFGVYSLISSKKVLATKQYPAPSTYVLSNWEVYKGKKAIIYGRLMFLLNIILLLMASFWLALSINLVV